MCSLSASYWLLRGFLGGGDGADRRCTGASVVNESGRKVLLEKGESDSVLQAGSGDVLIMKITKIEISNIRGIESLVIEPGTFTVISGRNAQGKSSVIAGLQALVSGGHDPGLIRKGAESGSVKATLDD